MTLTKMVENRVINKNKKESEKAVLYAKQINELFDTLNNSQTKTGALTLDKKNFKGLGKRKVNCFYYVKPEETTVMLDYSLTKTFDFKGFDNIKLNYLTLEEELNKNGITLQREMSHPEYDNSDDYEDIIILKGKRLIKER